MKGYGDKISYYRKKKKISQEELGKKLNVTRSYISKLENEKTPMSLETLYKISEILEVNPSDLIENVLHDPPKELKEAGAEWIMLGKKMEEQGITSQQIEEWAKIVKSFDK